MRQWIEGVMSGMWFVLWTWDVVPLAWPWHFTYPVFAIVDFLIRVVVLG